MLFKARIAISVSMLVCAGGALAQAQSALPEVAARYLTTVTEAAKPPRTSEWILLRGPSRVERRNLANGEGDAWQRSATGALYYERLFPADRKLVEFTAGELRALNVKARWDGVATLVDEHALRTRFVESGEEDFEGRRATRFIARSADAEMEIVWLADQRLPLSISERTGTVLTQTRLQEFHPLAQSPWQPTATGDFERIDYADFGDKENDPFVSRITAQSGGHGHSH